MRGGRFLIADIIVHKEILHDAKEFDTRGVTFAWANPYRVACHETKLVLAA